MNIPIPFIGGGGGSSDDCTATASDVLEGKTAVYNGSGDEPAAGSMKDYSGTTQSATASLDSSNNRVQMTVPNTGKYDTNAKLYSAFSNLADTIDLTADKLASGQTVLGVTGTYKPTITSVNSLAYVSDITSNNVESDENTYTATADGTCYASVIAGVYGQSILVKDIVLELYINGTRRLEDNINSDQENNYVFRGNSSVYTYSVHAGDVIRTVAKVNSYYEMGFGAIFCQVVTYP